MDVNSKHHGNVLVVEVVGELDHHTASDLKSEIKAQLDKGLLRHIVLDFSGLVFMDSSGLGVLLGRYRELSKWKGQMLACGLQPAIGKMFNLTGLDKLIAVHDDVNSCLRALGE